MHNDFKSPSFILGVSILLLVPFGIGGLTYSTLRNDDTEQQTGINKLSENSNYGQLARESNIPLTSPSLPETNASGDSFQTPQGIPIGKYSNPPTKIEDHGVDNPHRSSLSNSNFGDNLGSSFENTSLDVDSSLSRPDYSAPNSSNNFKRPENSSLIAPSPTEELLSIPETNFDQSDSFSPTVEPLLQP
ncbi:MAG: hypothetical protein AAGA16_04590 [Cyanobacteria bacterium P01_E01_bin.35]